MLRLLYAIYTEEPFVTKLSATWPVYLIKSLFDHIKFFLEPIEVELENGKKTSLEKAMTDWNGLQRFTYKVDYVNGQLLSYFLSALWLRVFQLFVNIPLET